jgi:hypothetical protein
MKTQNIFKKGDLFYYVDSDISLLPDTFEEKIGKYGSRKLEKPMTFAEMQKEYTPAIFTLGDVYNAIKTGQCLGNGYANFFFVLNKDGTVSVVRVRRYDWLWCVYVDRLDCDGRWSAECRLFIRNSGHSESPETLTLDQSEETKATITVMETITWRDSRLYIQQENNDGMWDVCEIESIGFIIFEDKKCVALAGDMLDSKEKVRRVLVIPKENIIKRKKLVNPS